MSTVSDNFQINTILPYHTTIMESIIHEVHGNKGGFYYELEGNRLGEMVYSMAAEKQMIIEHTEVDEWLKGQGVGKKLLAELVAFVRKENIKVIPSCPFANATFKRMEEWQDVLVNAMV